MYYFIPQNELYHFGIANTTLLESAKNNEGAKVYRKAEKEFDKAARNFNEIHIAFDKQQHRVKNPIK